MPSPPSPRATVPPGERSAVPSVPGIPAWAAVLVAVGATGLGIVVDAVRGSELTSVFAVLYVLGCVLAVVAVRHRGLFTAMVQPPLVLFVSVPVAYQLITEEGGTSLKDIVLNVAIPLVNRFPLMVVATVIVLIIGGARFYFDQRQGADRAHGSRRPTRGRTAPESGPIGARSAYERPTGTRSADPRSAGSRPTDDARSSRSRDRMPVRGPERTRESDPAAAGDSASRASAPRPSTPRSSTPRSSTPRTRRPIAEPPIPHYPRQEPATPYSDPRAAGPRNPDPARRRPDSPQIQPYPPPRVRYRDRD